jgi:hypothetical protein
MAICPYNGPNAGLDYYGRTIGRDTYPFLFEILYLGTI